MYDPPPPEYPSVGPPPPPLYPPPPPEPEEYPHPPPPKPPSETAPNAVSYLKQIVIFSHASFNSQFENLNIQKLLFFFDLYLFFAQCLSLKPHINVNCDL